MASVNKVIIVGNLGKDPDVRHSANGDAITNITVATTYAFGKGDDRKEETEWHRVVFFGKLAEIAGQYLEKGKPVYIEGRLRTRKWQNKEGQDQYTTEIVADQMQMLGGRDSGQERQAPKPAPSKPQPPKPADGHDDIDSEIPF